MLHAYWLMEIDPDWTNWTITAVQSGRMEVDGRTEVGIRLELDCQEFENCTFFFKNAVQDEV